MANLLNAHFRRTNRENANDITFDPDMLKLLLAIDETKTIGEIAKEVGLSSVAFKASLVKLVKLNLIERVEETGDYVHEDFLKTVSETLVQLMGPLGEMLIEEVAEDMQLHGRKIPKSTLADFIYNIAREIPAEKQSNEFKKAMLEEMKKYIE